MSPKQTSLAAAFERGTRHHRAGQLPLAEAMYRQVLAVNPRHADSLHRLGIIALQVGRAEAALPYIDAAIKLHPRAGYHNDRGLALSRLGRHAEAEPCYREAIRRDPTLVDAHNNLGGCLKDLNRLHEAEPCFREALRLQPDSSAALTNLADALTQLERYEEAEACCRKAVRLKPDFAEAYNTLGSVLRVLGRPAEAEAACRVALRLRPNFALAHNNLGCAIRGPGRAAEAAASFCEAVRLMPEFAEAHNNLGKALTELGHLDEAEAHLQKAIDLRSNFLEAQVNLGNLMLAQGRYAEIIPHYERILAQDPHFTSAWLGLLGALPYIPDLDARTSSRLHRGFGRAMAAVAARKPLPLANDRDPARRLRVGWLSSDFHDHPVGRNLKLFFAHHDRDSFETYCYADAAISSPLTDWFRREADTWRPISGLSNAAVAELIRNDRIDVMVYVAGRFDRNRPQVAAWRPAPVQISLFDAATSGLAEMDYFVADRVTVPAHSTEDFIERVLRLPNFYLHAPPADHPLPVDPPCLSARHITFGCFHNPTKLNPKVLALWGKILQRVPQSRLRFKYTDLFASRKLQETVCQRVGAEFRERIEFDPIRSPLGEHLAQYNRIDIALDPFPFNGSTATFEALWMGVPVVTLTGGTFMGRWTASMLTKVDLSECIAALSEDYVDIAARLAADQDRLAELRHSLRERVRRSVLCDGPRTTRYFERALRAVWRKWCRDGNPAGQRDSAEALVT